MIYNTKDMLKNNSIPCANTYHDVINFEVDGMFENV